MGEVKHKLYEELIPAIPDRNPNRILIFKDGYGMISVNFRNLKWHLKPEEFEEWAKVFEAALEKFEKQDKLKYNI